ncbi:hypothetical protein Tco_1013654 [Tanacetum coccineum]
MGLWYSKDSCIALTAFVDADHAGCQDTRRSTSGSMQLLAVLVHHQEGQRLKIKFLLANKKYIVDAKVFRKILDICLRVEGEEFTKVQDDDANLTFLINLGYKGLLHKYTNMYVDHMHQPWRTLTAIINTLVADVDVSKEANSEPAIKRTTSRRVVKKKVITFVAENIIPDPDVALELGTSISLTEAAKEEAARQAHATHARIVAEFEPGPAKKKTSSRSTRGVVIQDTPSSLKPKPATSKLKLKEMTDDEETDDEFVHSNEQVNDDEDEEMLNAEDDAKKAELPPTSSSLSVSSGFGDQFLKLSSNTSLIGTVKDTTDAEINPLLAYNSHINTQNSFNSSCNNTFTPSICLDHTTCTSPYNKTNPSPSFTIEAPTITTDVLESNALTAIQLKVAKLEKDVSGLKKMDHSVEALAIHKSQVPTVVEHFLGSRISDDLQKVLQRHNANLIQKYSVKPTLESSKIQSPKVDPEQESEKSALDIRKDENAMDKGVADTVKNHKRRHDDDDDDDDKDPSAGPNRGKKKKRRSTKESKSSKKPSTTKKTSKGKAPSKSSKTGKYATAKELVEKPIAEVVMDDAVNTMGEDVVRDDDKPQCTSEYKTYKTPNQDWFKQPPRPPTPDPELNKHQVVLNQLEQSWFNQIVSAT